MYSTHHAKKRLSHWRKDNAIKNSMSETKWNKRGGIICKMLKLKLY